MYAVIPLPDARVDVVVCDLPFGRKFGTRTEMAAKLPLIFTEMERCVSLYYKEVFAVSFFKSFIIYWPLLQV